VSVVGRVHVCVLRLLCQNPREQAVLMDERSQCVVSSLTTRPLMTPSPNKIPPPSSSLLPRSSTLLPSSVVAWSHCAAGSDSDDVGKFDSVQHYLPSVEVRGFAVFLCWFCVFKKLLFRFYIDSLLIKNS